MASYVPVYRLRVYAADDTTVLTPRAGSVHSDPFQVATATGVSGYEPILEVPRGRRGEFDPISRRVDTGRLTFRLLDTRTGTLNSERWVTAFVGGDEGENALLGKRVEVEESTDGGSGWGTTRFFTGRITDVSLSGKTFVEITVRDMAEELNDEVFFDVPSPLLSYIAAPPLLPIGIVEDYGPVPKSPPLKGTTESVSITNYGSGIRISTDWTDETTQRLNVITRPLSRIAAAESENWGSALWTGGATFGSVSRRVRVRLTITSGARTGESGDFFVQRSLITYAGGTSVLPTGIPIYTGLLFAFSSNGEKFGVTKIGLAEVDSNDPNYLALPPAGVDVDWYIVGANSPPSKDTPILVDDVAPLDFVRDILDGYYGALNEDGTPKRSYGYKEASLAAIEANRTLPTFRAAIDDAEKINDILEDWICLPYNLGYRVDGDGDVVFFDLDLPSSAAGITTIASADISDGRSPTEWSTPIDSAITRVDATFYFESYTPLDEILNAPERVPDYPAFKIEEFKVPFIKVDIGNPLLGDRKIKIDAKGFRFLSQSDPELYSETANIDARDAIVRDLDELTEKIRTQFGDGIAITLVPGKRSSSSVSGCFPGDLRILNIDEFPNPAGNVRGGVRLARCVSRREEGPSILLGFADAGSSTVALPPTIGTLSLTTGAGAHSIDVPVTLNAAGDRVMLLTATTATSVGTRPAESSGLWKFAASVESSTTVSLPGHRSGMRIWVAAYSAPLPSQGLKLPSAWTYSTGTDYVDTVAVATPASFVVTPSGNGGVATWTNTANYPIEVWLVQGADERRLEKIPAGLERYVFTRLATSTLYTAKIRYIDPFFGVGPFATDDFTTSATPDVSPALRGATLVVGDG